VTAPQRCSHRPPCPGCPAFGEQLGEQLAPLRTLADEAGAALEVGATGAAFGYRVRARLAVRGRAGSPKLGIFQERSHRVVDVPRCPVHHPLVNQVAAELRAAMRELGVAPYAEAPHAGLVRYLQVVVERGSRRAQVVLVVNAASTEPVRPLCERIRERLGVRLQGLFSSPNDARGNRILGERCEQVWGEAATTERIAGAQVFFPPDAFGQSNLDLYEVIVRRIGELVPDGADVTELYAGTGAIGLSLAPRARRVRLNELGEGSLAGLRLGVAALAPEVQARVSVHAGDAGAQGELLHGADVVIDDPPRKGLAPGLCDALRAAQPARLLYVSCGVDSFVRDARRLLAADDAAARPLKLRALIAYDLFPNTGHVETLACFEPS
jgi:tRNA/tmRNA/rRNA uracil-C5-methylase (TrmA/RlmC/RlmD family)